MGVSYIVSVGFMLLIHYYILIIGEAKKWSGQSQTARTSSVALDGDRNRLSGGSYTSVSNLEG